MEKKILSIIMTSAMLLGSVPASAVGDFADEEAQWELKDIGTDTDKAAEPALDVIYTEKPEENDDIGEYEPIVHVETVDDMFEFPEDDENLLPDDANEPSVASLSSSSSSDSIWESMYTQVFGDNYLKPYEKREDGQVVSGNTNRLSVEETDLTLPGKNGLDVVIRRRFDNQNYNIAYCKGTKGDCNTVQDRYIYAFTNQSDKSTMYVGFAGEDHMYEYMYDGVYLKQEPNTKKAQTCTDSNGNKITYYDFEDVEPYITDSDSYDRYEYDSSKEVIGYSKKYEDIYTYTLEDWQLFRKTSRLGAGWDIDVPEAYVYRYSYTKDDNDYDEDYVGAFRDMDGTVYMLSGYGLYTAYTTSSGKSDTYTSSFSAKNDYDLHFESFYATQTLDDETQYNFVVYTGEGLTYYMYDTGMNYGNRPNQRRSIYVTAVTDDYGNKICYEYNSDYSMLTKIIDTYGREINFTSNSGVHTISYSDGEQTREITYKSEELPASTLDNDSTLRARAVSRMTVTNQEGEKTIYDSRQSNVISYYSAATTFDIHDSPDPTEETVCEDSGYNLERVIYPTGAETRYKYRCLRMTDSVRDVMSEVYAVESSYDVLNGEKYNEKEYSFTNKKMAVTKTCLQEDKAAKTTSIYDDDGKVTSEKTESTDSGTYTQSVSYTYNSYGRPATVSISDNGISLTQSYTYALSNTSTLKSVSDGRRKIEYEYYKRETDCNGSTFSTYDKSKPTKVTYKDLTGTSEDTDYYIERDLTEDNKGIEYERVVQDDKIKSQTKYAYDDSGNITSVKRWTSDTNSDGTLDENDDTADITSVYEVTEQKTLNVTDTAAGLLDADGADAGAVTEVYSYSVTGVPTSKTDSVGSVTTIEYDAVDRPVKCTMPNGSTRTIAYNTAKNYTEITDESGITTKQQYDGLGRIAAVYRKDKNGTSYYQIEAYTYDSSGRVATKTAYRTADTGTQEAYEYDAFDRVTKREVYELPSTLLYTEQYAYSTLTQVITDKTVTGDGFTAAEVKEYADEYGDIVKTESISSSDTLTTSYEYDYAGNKVAETDPNGNTTAYEYAYDGKLTKTTDAEGNSTSTEYDMAGRAIKSTDANGNATQTTYDKLDRAIQVTAPFNGSVSTESKTYYDQNSNVVKTSVKRSSDTYDVTEYQYDVMGNNTASIVNNGTSNIVTQYKYDTVNRLTETITGLTEVDGTDGASTTYAYNSAGYLASMTDPLGNAETYGSYDYAGNVGSVTDRSGKTRSNSYGTYGLTKTSFSDTDETKEYTYNNIGQLTASTCVNANGDTVTERYTYDAFGRMTGNTSTDGSVQSYTYDDNSNVVSYGLKKDGKTKNSLTYAYSATNRLTSLSGNGIITSYTYDANGNVTEAEQSNGVNTSYTYNEAGLMTNLTTKKDDTVYTSSECDYLLDGLLQTVTMPSDTDSSASKTKTFGYDSAGRLTFESVLEAGNLSLNRYRYDSRGNRTKLLQRDYGNDIYTTTTYSYDMNNKLLSTATTEDDNDTISNYSERYYYDDNGNMTAKQTSRVETSGKTVGSNMKLSGRSTDTGIEMEVYRYDSFNRLSSYNGAAVEATYTYNADNIESEWDAGGF